MDLSDYPPDFRGGFLAVLGRPNTGKSTLTNALVGEKIAIMSDKPETTRRAIRGIVHRPAGQLVLVDTPGLHRPRTLLGKRLNDIAHESLDGVDAVLVTLPANEKLGPGDRFVADLAFTAGVPVVAVVTKIDTISRDAVALKLIEVSQFAEFAEIVPISAAEGDNVERLVEVLIGIVPLSPPLYPAGHVTDESETTRMAELIREAALDGVRDELPHSIAVAIDDIAQRGSKLAIFASIYVERDSQKAIVIGKRASRLKTVGIRARREIEAMVGRGVHLDLHVKVARDWQRDPKQLGRLGF